jgi:hypothetical protein
LIRQYPNDEGKFLASFREVWCQTEFLARWWLIICYGTTVDLPWILLIDYIRFGVVVFSPVGLPSWFVVLFILTLE